MAFKTVWLLRRNPSLSREEFIDYYETKHSKFIEFTPGVQRYFRRYPRVVGNLNEGLPDFGFDVMMEMWFENEAAYHAAIERVHSTIWDEIQEDEGKLFDRGSEEWCVTLAVEVEYETDLESPARQSTYESGD